MRSPKHSAIPIEVMTALYEDADLSLEAKALFLLLYAGFDDVDFSDPEQLSAFEDLHGKNYLKYSLSM